ncbi:MAG: MFS transporter, partial [Verrucomicrobia bacterium]|nr:MFS transporter [Verrucomicrobiota bacterium]
MKHDTAASQEPGLRGFWSLFITQFQGAFSDNVLKNLVVFLIVGMSMSLTEKHRIGELVGALFALPFILFSMAGGFLADRHSKRTITIGVKIFEVFVMSLALVGLIRQSIPLLLCTVFLMGTHSAFFGPSKYGSLPELLPPGKLSWGNGLLELGTFMAIILGTVVAGILSVHFKDRHGWSGLLLIVLSFLGLATSLGITRIPAANPTKRFQANFLADLFGRLASIKNDRPLRLAVAGNSFFNFIGALMLLNLFFYGSDVLHVDEIQIGKLCAALALGIGAGSVAAGYLSGSKIEYGLVPLGAAGLCVAALSLTPAGLTFGSAVVRLALLGFAGGFFIVPIAALLQHRPDPDKKGEIQAMANLLSFVGVFLASGAHFVLTSLKLDPCQIFLFIGLITLAGAIYAFILLPEALLRFVLWVFTRTVYRLRVEGRENIPARGGGLLVCNHLSFVDALLLLASTDREIQFFIFKGIYQRPWIRPFAKVLRAIPISSELRPREMIAALRLASESVRAGNIVCIFAEGQITRTGQMLPFRRGFERIMKGVDAPIIPVALDGVWGSIFSFEKGRFLWKMP